MALGSVGFTVPFAACGHWRAGPSATIIIVMNESLRQHLECLARDECYRVDAVLKEGRLERTGFPNRCPGDGVRPCRSVRVDGSDARGVRVRGRVPRRFSKGISYCWYGLCAGRWRYSAWRFGFRNRLRARSRIPAWSPNGWRVTVRQRWVFRRFRSRRRHAWCGRAGFVVCSAWCIYVA